MVGICGEWAGVGVWGWRVYEWSGVVVGGEDVVVDDEDDDGGCDWG